MYDSPNLWPLPRENNKDFSRHITGWNHLPVGAQIKVKISILSLNNSFITTKELPWPLHHSVLEYNTEVGKTYICS